MLSHMKINVSFGPSSGTDMSNFRPWLMDYYMADCAIILYLECLIGLIYHFKKLGHVT